MDSLFLTSRRHWWEQVNNTVIEFHLSMTSGSSWERTRSARLIDRDSNDCAISPPLNMIETNKLSICMKPQNSKLSLISPQHAFYCTPVSILLSHCLYIWPPGGSKSHYYISLASMAFPNQHF